MVTNDDGNNNTRDNAGKDTNQTNYSCLKLMKLTFQQGFPTEHTNILKLRHASMFLRQSTHPNARCIISAFTFLFYL